MADEIVDSAKLLIQIAVPQIANDASFATDIIYNTLNCDFSFYRTFGHDLVFI